MGIALPPPLLACAGMECDLGGCPLAQDAVFAGNVPDEISFLGSLASVVGRGGGGGYLGVLLVLCVAIVCLTDESVHPMF